jgi:hypothetical protein
VNWALSPRTITIAAPSTEVTIQDLVDTIRVLESEILALDDYSLIRKASGKEDLEGGVLVGLTLKLRNAKVAFEGRTTAAADGTATSADPVGEELTDSGVDFGTSTPSTTLSSAG